MKLIKYASIILSAVILAFSVSGCMPDFEDVDIDNTNYRMSFGVDTEYQVEELKQPIQQLYDAYYSKISALPGFITSEKGYFRIDKKTLNTAIEEVTAACKVAEKDIPNIVLPKGTSIEVFSQFQASNGLIGTVYSKIYYGE